MKVGVQRGAIQLQIRAGIPTLAHDTRARNRSGASAARSNLGRAAKVSDAVRSPPGEPKKKRAARDVRIDPGERDPGGKRSEPF